MRSGTHIQKRGLVAILALIAKVTTATVQVGTDSGKFLKRFSLFTSLGADRAQICLLPALSGI